MASLKGRATSLFAWGLLVGGVAILTTFPAGTPPQRLGAVHVPAAILFALGGLVFGLSHPERRAWLGGVFLAWVPFVAGIVAALNGEAPEMGVFLVLLLAPVALAGVGAWTGAVLSRRRSRPG